MKEVDFVYRLNMVMMVIAFQLVHVNLLHRLGETCGPRVHVHMYSIYKREGFLVVEINLNLNSMVGLCSRDQEYAGLSQSTRGCYM